LTLSPDLQPGPYACLSVADTGTGMDKVTIEKVFDPFFTTKKKGKDTGMGLSVVYGIVKAMGFFCIPDRFIFEFTNLSIFHSKDCSDDWIPIYDKSDLPGFYMAVGTSGNQYKNAPVVGRMMAELVDACEKGLDHDNDPFQYEFKYTERTLNVGFFSRKREINYESSFSVNG